MNKIIKYTNNTYCFTNTSNFQNELVQGKFRGRKINAGIVIDTSGSMSEFIGNNSKIEIVKSALNEFLIFGKLLQENGIKINVNIVVFSSSSSFIYEGENLEQAKLEVNKLYAGGCTTISLGLNNILPKIKEDYENTFIILTDGYADDQHLLMNDNKYKNCMNASIGIGSLANYNETLLNYLSTKENTFGGYSGEELSRNIMVGLLVNLMIIGRNIQIKVDNGMIISTNEVEGNIIKIPILTYDQKIIFKTNGLLSLNVEYSIENKDDNGDAEMYILTNQKMLDIKQDAKEYKKILDQVKNYNFRNIDLLVLWNDMIKELESLSKATHQEDIGRIQQTRSAGFSQMSSAIYSTVTPQRPVR
jgi:hypothetical protein